MVNSIKTIGMAALIVLLTSCANFGVGGLINSSDEAQELGAYLFIDTRHMESTLSVATGLNNSNTRSVGSGLAVKYPFTLSSVSLFPLANFEFQSVYYEEGTASNFGWLRFGAGLDYSISNDIFLRGEALYAPVMFWFAPDKIYNYKESGVSVRLGVGIRPSFFSSNKSSSSKGTSSRDAPPARGNPPAQSPSPTNRDGWDIRSLDTARNVNYLSALEKDVILELNMVRSDPRKYAQMYINPSKSAAAREAHNVLTRASSIPVLQPRRGLSQAAKDHVLDTGPKGITGHTGSDGSTLSQRANRYGTWRSGISENCSYGMNTARDINIQLLESPGHRTNIMNRDSRVVGVATGPHSQYRVMCVQKFAVDYTDR